MIQVNAYGSTLDGMSADDVFNANIKKNGVNFKRQETGYAVMDENDSKHI